MLASAIIVFREVLEAALIIGIVLAATTGISGRSIWIAGGVFAGVAGAGAVAFFADSIATMAQGSGQEIFNAAALGVAVLMLGWHQIWMSRHGREMSMAFKSLGQSVKAGERTLLALAVVVGSAILREGSETVLFLFGIASTADAGGFADLAAGASLGLLLGAVCGGGLYFGLLRIPPKHLFGVTGWFIILLAAAMASQAAGFLVQAGYLPTLVDELWDSSSVLQRSSPLGQLLHILVGYDDRPTGIQMLLYVGTILCIFGLSRWLSASGSNGVPSGKLRSAP